MNQRVVVGVVAVLVALVVAALVLLVGRDAEERAAVARDYGVTAAELPGATEADLADLSDETRARIEAVRDAGAPNVVVDLGAEQPAVVRDSVGRVLDLAGAPVAGVAVARRDEPARAIATSAPDGSFELPPGASTLVVADARWYTLRETEPLPTVDGTEVVVIVAPAIVVGGRVQDPEGNAVADARVRLELAWAVYAAFPVPLDHARESHTVEAQSAADGTFELTLPAAPRARLEASKEGFVEQAIDPGLVPRTDLVITLAPRGPSGALRVEGVVVHADGTPGIDAVVRYGEGSAPVDGEGRFSIPVEHGLDELPLVAVKKGFQAAVVPAFSAVIAKSAGTLPFQRLVLGGTPLSIEGRVVDHEGRPKPGWLVQPVDPLMIRDGHIPPDCAEALARGEAIQAKSDDDGAFVLDGLQERAYRLQAHSGTELVRIESEPIAAGARNVRLVVPADARIAKVAGVVVGLDGTPIAGAEVKAGLIVFRIRWGYTSESSAAVTTDAEGRFELAHVPRRNSKLDFGGDAILPTSHDLEGHVDGTPVRIVAARRCHARVEGVPATTNLRWVQVHDANGQELSLMQFQSGGWMTSTQVELVDGASPLFAVSEAARTVVLTGEDQPDVARPLVLAPGAITVVRW